MKNIAKFLFVFAILFSTTQISAQNLGAASDALSQAGDKMNVSSAISEVANGIKPEAFKSDFKMSDLTSKLSSLDMDNISDVKGSMGSLIGGLKDSSFLKGAKSGIMKSLSGLTEKADVSALLGSLVNGIKPEMLTEAFAGNKSNFLKSLNLLK